MRVRQPRDMIESIMNECKILACAQQNHKVGIGSIVSANAIQQTRFIQLDPKYSTLPLYDFQD